MKYFILPISAFFILECLVGCGKSSKQVTGSRESIEPKNSVETKKPADFPIDSQLTLNLDNPRGFYPLNVKGLPDVVRAAGSSVFELRVLAAGENRLLRVVDVSNGQGSKFKDNIRKMKTSSIDANSMNTSSMNTGSLDENDKTVLIKQIESCEGNKDITYQMNCLITFDIRKSTGFLTGEGSTLWTNAHVVDGFMSFVEKFRDVKFRKKSKFNKFKKIFSEKQRIAVFIFNKEGELLLNPYLDQATIGMAPPMTYMARVRNTFFAEDSDYIGLSLSRPIGKPLKVADKLPLFGQRIFLFGYPACTACNPESFQVEDPNDFADRSPGPNSDGKGLKVSSGVLLEPKSQASFFEVQESLMDYWQLDRMFLSTADSNHGNSGGPLLNERGEVVAIHTGGKSRIIDGKVKRISRSVIFF